MSGRSGARDGAGDVTAQRGRTPDTAVANQNRHHAMKGPDVAHGVIDAKSDTAAAISVRLVIPCHAIGANQVSGSSHLSYGKHKKQVMRDVPFLWAEAGRPAFERAIVDVVIVVGKGGRYDPQNFHGAGTVKFVIDALTKCGAWADDKPPHMTMGQTTVEYRRDVWAVELTITESEGES